MAGAIKEQPLSPEQLKGASTNYLRCLNLPPSSQVLIITDKFPKNIGEAMQNDLSVREDITTSLKRQINREGHRVAMVSFDNNLSFDEFRAQTNQALKELDNKEGVEGIIDDTTTIVYLGEKWEKRFGMYQGA